MAVIRICFAAFAAMILLAADMSKGQTKAEGLSARVRAAQFDTRRAALAELAILLKQGSTSDAVIDAFLEAGAESDHVLRMTVGSLSSLVSPAAQPKLEEALSRPEAYARSQALHALMALGEKAQGSRAKILNLLDDPAESVRQDTAVAIAKIDATGESFPVLLKMLSDPNASRRRLAAVALDAFDTRVSPLSRELVARLGDSDENVRYWLVIVVGNLKGLDSAIPPILASILLHDSSSFVRERAARELWEMAVNHQQLPREAAEALETTLSRDGDVGVRTQVARALAAVDRTAYAALFRKCADAETGLLQKACAEALSK